MENNVLELRFYSREEIAQIIGIPSLKDSHFVEKVKRYLKNRKYEYVHIKAKGYQITKIPTNAEEQLTCLLREKLGLDKQIKVFDFACFIVAFELIDGFDLMPWQTREKAFEQYFGQKMLNGRMSRYMSKLFDAQVAVKFKKASLWKTTKDEKGVKHQEPQDVNSPEYAHFCEERSVLLKEYQAQGMSFSQAWGQMMKALSGGGVYYYCAAIAFNAFGDTAEEITRLVYDVMAEHQEK